MRTHDLGRLFWHTVRLSNAPLLHRGRTSMVDEPYHWSRPLIIRLPQGRGLAVGWWHRHRQLDISAHLAQALSLADLDQLPGDGWITGEGELHAPAGRWAERVS